MAVPQWRIQIVKGISSETWSNDYLTSVLLMADAVSLANSLVAFERAMHGGQVRFEYMRISTMVEGDRTFRHVPINQNGNVAIGDHLPLYCTARMDMSTADSDPCRKYYRIPIPEVWQTSGIINPEILTSWQNNINTLLPVASVLGWVVSSKGNNVTGATFHSRVQMRQLHRRKRPKMTQAQFDAQ